METKKSKDFAYSLLVGIAASLIAYALGSAFRLPDPSRMMTILFGAIWGTAAMVLSMLVYFRAIAKRTVNGAILVVISVVAALIKAAVTPTVNQMAFSSLIRSRSVQASYFQTVGALVSIVLGLIFFTLGAFLAHKLSKGTGAAADSAYQPSGNSFSPSAGSISGGGSVSGAAVADDDYDELSGRILTAVKPLLKSPLTAVLCSKEEMVFTPDGSGGYRIVGYVSAQNAYGAMVQSEFIVDAINAGGSWLVQNAKVGIKQAKEAGKNFVRIWIFAIIITLLLSLLFYMIYSMIL